MLCDDISAIAVHVGHLRSYIGFVGDETPSYQTDSFFYHNQQEENSFALIDDFSPNKELTRGILTPLISERQVSYPDNFCHFVAAMAEKINVNLSETGVILTTNTPHRTTNNQNPIDNRDMVMANMFEKFKTPALFFTSKKLSCLFASGRSAGVVVDSGAYFTEVVCVSHGYILRKSELISDAVD